MRTEQSCFLRDEEAIVAISGRLVLVTGIVEIQGPRILRTRDYASGHEREYDETQLRRRPLLRGDTIEIDGRGATVLEVYPFDGCVAIVATSDNQVRPIYLGEHWSPLHQLGPAARERDYQAALAAMTPLD